MFTIAHAGTANAEKSTLFGLMGEQDGGTNGSGFCAFANKLCKIDLDSGESALVGDPFSTLPFSVTA